MERKLLLEKLNLAKPALASKGSILPVYTHFCFDGVTITSYNDVMAVLVDHECDMNDAIDGARIIGLLEASSAKEVEFKQKDGEVHMKYGRSNSKLPTLPPEDFIFELPDIKSSLMVNIDNALIKGIELCLSTMGIDSTRPSLLGITLSLGKKDCVLYSSDTVSVSRFELDIQSKKERAVILPPDFCKTLVRTVKSLKKDGELFIGEDHVIAIIDSVTLFSKLLEDDSSVNFEEVIDEQWGDVDPRDLVPLPTSIGQAIKASQVLTSGVYGWEVRLEIVKNKLHMDTETHKGDTHAVIPLKADHPDVVASIDTTMLEKALAVCDMFYVTEDTILLSGESDAYLHLISNGSDATPTE
ncbi:hypothetical protein LCGC14_0231670 [marine sediment metagenome]|uniref:DNA polymerase III beta sliding clamp central domain-containing protein n=1 Tax=marine sediment metagenome TaxID=412755 RepID=A0A0F9UEG6_9ZZZZ